MKKMIRRALTLTLAVLMVMSLGTTAFAAGDTYFSDVATVTKPCTVSFQVGAEAETAGVTAPAAVNVNKGGLLKVDDLPNAIWETQEENPVPVKCMVGWYLDEALTQRVEADLTVNENMTLYAMWAEHIPGCADECEVEGCGCFCHTATVPETYELVDGGTGKIRVTKTFEGLSLDEIKAHLYADFVITVKHNDDEKAPTHTLKLADDKITATNAETKTTTFTWEISNASIGNYTVSESGELPDTLVAKYSVHVRGTGGSVNVPAGKFVGESGKYTPNSEDEHIPITIDGDKNNVLVVSLTNSGGDKGCVILSKKNPLTASEVQAIMGSFTEGSWPTPYTVKYLGGTQDATFPFNGGTITYHAADSSISFSSKDIWKMLGKARYDIEQAEGEPIGITNTYTPKTTDITITKKVKGNMGDVNKPFDFEVTFDQPITGATPYDVGYRLSSDGKTAYFTLKNGESVTLTGVRKDANIVSIVETNSDGYVKTIMIDGQVIDLSQKWPIPDDGVLEILVVNEKEVTIDTGVILDSLPYVLILGLVVVGFLFLRKRRHSDDD